MHVRDTVCISSKVSFYQEKYGVSDKDLHFFYLEPYKGEHMISRAYIVIFFYQSSNLKVKYSLELCKNENSYLCLMI